MIFALVGFGILYAVLAAYALQGMAEARKSAYVRTEAIVGAVLRVADEVRKGQGAYDPEAFAELRADVGLLPMTWQKVLEEISEQAEKASRERNRVDKVWERAVKRLEKSEGDPGLEAEMDSAGIPYVLGGPDESLSSVHDGVETRPAHALKWGGSGSQLAGG